MAASPDLFRTGLPRAAEALRASTGALHRTLDQMPLMRRIADPQVELDDYRAYLRAQLTVMERWWAICPVCVASAAPETIDVCSAGLREDLAALGGEQGSISLLWPRNSWSSHAPQWWGALYVIEGARLGACSLAAKLESSLGSRSANAMRFLSGRRTAHAHWPALLGCIDMRIGRHVDQAVEGAFAAYGWYAQCLALAQMERDAVSIRT